MIEHIPVHLLSQRHIAGRGRQAHHWLQVEDLRP